MLRVDKRTGWNGNEASRDERQAPIESPLTADCPRCKKEWEDFDGFGVLYCPAWAGGCGYCKHASRTDGQCDFCGHRAASTSSGSHNEV